LHHLPALKSMRPHLHDDHFQTSDSWPSNCASNLQLASQLTALEVKFSDAMSSSPCTW
jgi:hypothetical protein